MELVILALLIVSNGVFAMSEMAVVSSRKARLQQLSDEGHPGAAAAAGLAAEPLNFLSTIQVGITLIGITSGAFGEAALAEDLSKWLSQWAWLAANADAVAVVLVVAGITIASLIVGELVPKRLALLNPEAVASVIAKPMKILSVVAYPLVRALSWVTDSALKLMGLGAATSPPVTEEEIEVLMEQGARAGVFEAHEEALVSRVFRLDRRTVESIMTPRTDIIYLDIEMDAGANADRMAEHGHSRYPVVRGGLDQIEGIIFAKDLLADAMKGKAIDLSSPPVKPLFVPTGISAIGLLEQFRTHRQTIAIAVSEYGDVEGLVTLNDVMEALVGDIATAEEQEEPYMVHREDGSWLIDGSTSIDQLRAELGLEQSLPVESQAPYHTVGGFVMERLGRVPRVGDVIKSAGWRWEVVDMDDKRVDKVLASKMPTD